VSDPRRQKIRIRNHGAGGKAATVAGYAGPGFPTWPSGHIPQDPDPKPFLRIRAAAKKTFGEALGAATGVSDPRLQKNRGARATTLGPQIRNDYAGKLTSRRGAWKRFYGSALGRCLGLLPDAPLRLGRGNPPHCRCERATPRLTAAQRHPLRLCRSQAAEAGAVRELLTAKPKCWGAAEFRSWPQRNPEAGEPLNRGGGNNCARDGGFCPPETRFLIPPSPARHEHRTHGPQTGN
jgi:hypothetical protein